MNLRLLFARRYPCRLISGRAHRLMMPARVLGFLITSASKTDLLRSRTGKATSFDDVFAFDKIEEDIRAKIDEETAGIIYEKRLPLQVIFGSLLNVGPVVDTLAEDARIRAINYSKKPLMKGRPRH